MVISRKFLFSFFPLFLFSSVQGQKVLNPELNSFQGQFIHYPVTVPGADISTTRILFDNKGFLWEGTGNALYRFDGNNYQTYCFRNIDKTSLAGQVVSSIYEDHEGIMWIGTYGALNRLDPNTGLIKQFMPDSANFMSNDNRIRLIYEDRDGLLWILTCGSLFSFDRNTSRFTKYLYECSYSSSSWANSPGQFLEDSRGSLWVVGKKGLSVRLKGKEFISLPFDSSDPYRLKSDRVSCVTEDKSGIIWCSTIGGGLHKIKDPEHGIIEQVKFTGTERLNRMLDTIMTILPDDNGTLWIFGNGIFANYSPGTGEIKSWLIRPMNKLFNNMKGRQMLLEEAFKDNNGFIWILQRQGIVLRFKPETEQLLAYNVPNWIILDWKADSYGSIWFGCANGNTWRLMLRSIPYQTVRVKNMFNVAPYDNPRITNDPSGRLWLTLSTGIYRDDAPDPGKNFTPAKAILPVADTLANCIIKDRSGNLWFGLKGNRVLTLNTSTNTHRIYSIPGPSEEEIYKIVEDARENMWFLSFNKIFILQPSSGRIRQFAFKDSAADSILREGIYDMLPDKAGNLWFASFSNCINVYNTDQGKVIRYYAESGKDLYAGDFCLRVKEDKKGRIWILFNNNGLYVYNPVTKMLDPVRLMPETPPGLNFFELFIDHNNRLFINHNYGLSIYDPDKNTLRQVRFSQQAGSYCSLELSSGYLLNLAGPELKFFHDTIPFNNVIPEVFLTGLKINEIDYHPGIGDLASLKQIRLDHNQNDLKIDFSALNYLYPSNNRYRYIMTGIDKDTILLSDYHSIEYKKLHSGKYNFWFTGSNNDGVWNNEGKSFEIVIRPPVTQTPAAYITYALVLFLLAAAFIRRHFRKLTEDRNRLENEVHLRTIELEEKNEKIEKMDRLKTRFFTEISHEIRTPLSLILGPVENLITENHRIDETRRMHLFDLIKRNSIRLLNLVNQLLDISKIDAGKMKLNLAESDILKSVRTLAYEFFSLAESRKIKFTIDISEKTRIILFDREKTEKIISNLLSNALKFTPANGQVTITAWIDDAENTGESPILNIVVKDTGIGISKDNISKIFERFYRVEGNRERDTHSTGIGLSLTQEFVTLLHGTIEVSSEKDAGSTFTVRIPVGTAHLGAEEYVLTEPYQEKPVLNHNAMQPGRSGLKVAESDIQDKKPHILIIEDNSDLKGFLNENLSGEYRVFEGASGMEGIEIAFTRIPDLIITDILMPDLDGIEVCTKLKNDERTSHIPIIILTARSAVEDRIEGLSAGADDYLLKPPDINEMKIRIKNLLVQREKLRHKYSILPVNGKFEGFSDTLDDKFMKKVTRLIEENLRFFDFDVRALQEEMGLSRVHLYRKLKALTGLTPSTLIYNQRMLRAAKLIRENSGNLTEIALSVGFSNPSYFSKCFREFYGVSPKRFVADSPKQPKVGRKLD